MEPAIAATSVDLPMPGSPESRTTDPATIPPPNTRSTSGSCVLKRSCSFCFATSERAWLCAAFAFELVDPGFPSDRVIRAGSLGPSCASSTSVPHFSQVTHLPDHLSDWASQCVHKNIYQLQRVDIFGISKCHASMERLQKPASRMAVMRAAWHSLSRQGSFSPSDGLQSAFVMH